MLVLLLLAFLGVDFLAGIKSLVTAKLNLVLAAFALFWVGALGRVATWVLLAFALKVGYQRVISYVRVFLVGMFAGLGLPQGSASFTRLAVIAADKRSVSRGIVAIGAERLVQTIVMLALLLIATVYLSAVNFNALQTLGLVVVLIGFVCLSIVLAARWLPRWSLSRRVLQNRRVQSVVSEVRSALYELRHIPPTTMAAIITVTLIAALATVTSLFLAARSLDLGLDFMVLVMAWAAVGITSLLPISINGFGPREGILTAAVAGAGINSEGGIALGLMWFFMQAVTRLTAGLLYFTVFHANREPFTVDNEMVSEQHSPAAA